MTVSGSQNYQSNSGSYVSYISSSDFPVRALDYAGFRKLPQRSNYNFQKPATTTTTTITESLTIKYYQRVYDAGTEGWCYYTGTSIDASPDSGDTTPNYTGAISNHSVVKILEIY